MKIVVKRNYNDKIRYFLYPDLEELEKDCNLEVKKWSHYTERNTISTILTIRMPFTKKPAAQILADSKQGVYDEIIFTIEG